MIIEAIFNMIFAIVSFIISLFPSFVEFGFDISPLIDILGYAFNFIDIRVFMFFISTYVFVYSSSFIWACIEWVYKKIPFLN